MCVIECLTRTGLVQPLVETFAHRQQRTRRSLVRSSSVGVSQRRFGERGSTGDVVPKLNVEGSSPFTRFLLTSGCVEVALVRKFPQQQYFSYSFPEACCSLRFFRQV